MFLQNSGEIMSLWRKKGMLPANGSFHSTSKTRFISHRKSKSVSMVSD